MKDQFLKSADKIADKSVLDFIEKIRDERPDLKNAMFYVPKQGKNSHVVMTSDEVFKAVKEHRGNSINEALLLKHLNTKDLSLAIPALTCIGEQSSFYGMKRTKGVRLTAEYLETLPKETQDKIAQDIGKFQAELTTAFTDEDYQKTGIEKKERWHLSVDNVLKTLEKPEVRTALGDNFEYCLGEANALKKSLHGQSEADRAVLTHSDLHSENILIDPETHEITVIDLGEGARWQVDLSFGPFDNTYPPSFTEKMLDSFHDHGGPRIYQPDLAKWNFAENLIRLDDALENRNDTMAKIRLEQIQNFRQSHDTKPSSQNAAPTFKKSHGLR